MSRLAVIMLGLTFLLPSAHAVVYPTRPEIYEVIADRAQVIREEDKRAIRTAAAELRRDSGIPLFVVTISSLAQQEASGLSFDLYALRLSEAWLNGIPNGSRGIIVLLSLKDRKTRIELGAGWGDREDKLSAQILDKIMSPLCKNGDCSASLREGTTAVAEMARGRKPAALGGVAAATGGFLDWVKQTATAIANGIITVVGVILFIIVAIFLCLTYTDRPAWDRGYRRGYRRSHGYGGYGGGLGSLVIGGIIGGLARSGGSSSSSSSSSGSGHGASSGATGSW